MLHVLQVSANGGYLGRVFENVVVEVFIVVYLVDELVHTRRWLSVAALEPLWTDDLTIVDNQFLIERCCQC